MKQQFIIPILLLLFVNSYSQENSNHDEFRNKGFFNITKLSYINVSSAKLETFNPVDGVVATSLNVDKAHAYSLQTINGYFFSPYFSAGIGVGLDGYSNPNFNTLPIFLDLRAYFSDEAKSLYLYMDYGTMAKIDGGKNNGSIFNIGLGYKFPLKDRLMFVTDLGYSYKSISNDGLSIRKSESWVQAKGLILSFGIIF
mgnify:FL=1|tara:strand:+ start:311 stop:904 length:594 start_codon:yes stop_codon:yes gene_type:complete